MLPRRRVEGPQRPADVARLRARRRDARRRQRAARIDIGIGVLAAIVLLLVSPGLAIAGLIGLLVLIACGVSVWRERRRGDDRAPARRSGARVPGPAGSRTSQPAAKRSSRPPRERIVYQPPRSRR